MKFNISNRQFLSAAIIVFYLIPLLFFSAYSIKLMSYSKSWTLLSLGLLLVVFGTLSLIFLLSYWEQSMRDKKSPNSLLLPPQPSFFTSEKEPKVTSLSPSLTFNPITPHELSENTNSKESSKELNLLQAALRASQSQQEELARTLEFKDQELQRQGEENKQLQIKAQQIAQDFSDYKLFSEEQLKQKQLQLAALQQTIEDQRTEMEKRQEQIHQLDTKVHDLSYEIKTLLYLNEEAVAPAKSTTVIKEDKISSVLAEMQAESQAQTSTAVIEVPIHQENQTQESPVRNSLEANRLLKKCIGFAQKLTGTNYYSNESSRYREFSSSYFAIDQRRLFDSLRAEAGALVVVYSQKENKLLFVNNESKKLLGWSPEKFLSDFASIMKEGMQDWKKVLQVLATTSESQIRLLAKTKQGQEILLNCHLGVVPSGLFRNYVMGVLYPA